MSEKVKLLIIRSAITLILLTLFSGVYLYLQINYLLNDYPENTYAFEGPRPSSLTIIFSGFYNWRAISGIAAVSALYSFLTLKLMRTRSIILNALIITFTMVVLYGGLKLITALSYDDGYWYIFRDELISELLIFTLLYLPVSFVEACWIGRIQKDKR